MLVRRPFTAERRGVSGGKGAMRKRIESSVDRRWFSRLRTNMRRRRRFNKPDTSRPDEARDEGVGGTQMTMARNRPDWQNVAVAAGLLVAVLMGLYPPWSYVIVMRDVRLVIPAGYSSIGTPPPRPARPGNVESWPPFHFPQVDITRLVVQWAVVAFGTAGAWILLRAKK